MIILKILLIILLAVLGLLILICIIPVGAEFSFIDGKLSYKVKLWFLNVMDSEGGGLMGLLKKRKRNKPPKPPKPKKRKKNKASPPKSVIDEEALNAEIEAACAEVGESPEKVQDEFSPAAEASTATDTHDEEEKSSGNDETSSDDDSVETAADIEDEFDDEEDDDDDDEDEGSSLGQKIDKLLKIWNSAKNPLAMIFKSFRFSELYIDFIIADEDAYKCAINYGKFSTIIYNGLAFLSRLFTVRFKTVDVQAGFGLNKSRWDVSSRFDCHIGTIVIAGIWFLITYIFRVMLPEKLSRRKKNKQAENQK